MNRAALALIIFVAVSASSHAEERPIEKAWYSPAELLTRLAERDGIKWAMPETLSGRALVGGESTTADKLLDEACKQWGFAWVRQGETIVVHKPNDKRLDELTKALTLIQTRKILQFPVVLMGKEYWAPFMAMCKMMVEQGTISAADLDLMLLTDSVPDAMAHIELHAVKQFGLKRRKMRARKIFGETSLNADTRRSS